MSTWPREHCDNKTPAGQLSKLTRNLRAFSAIIHRRWLVLVPSGRWLLVFSLARRLRNSFIAFFSRRACDVCSGLLVVTHIAGLSKRTICPQTDYGCKIVVADELAGPPGTCSIENYSISTLVHTTNNLHIISDSPARITDYVVDGRSRIGLLLFSSCCAILKRSSSCLLLGG